MHSSETDLEKKQSALRDLLRDCGSVVIGYSGGVDSVYLAKSALDALGSERVLAVTGRSPSYPDVQYRTALEVAGDLGLPHIEIHTGETGDPNYTANPFNRCYFCKTDLYSRLVALARARGFATVLDGSNADDLDDYRPGLAAARELGVRSPLQEADLTKEEIRSLSRRAGLPTWDMPASPCLASRIPYGIEVTPHRLHQIEVAEARLRELASWGPFRVRHHGEWARLELCPDDLRRFSDNPQLRSRVTRVLKESGFARACVDLEGYRRGALNEALAPR
ncbi:MAG: ATP-dependent sacrificial sulfur transferase LarE [Gemmatimonadota bacterium]